MESFLVRSVEPYFEAEVDMKYPKAIWLFCRYLFVPQRRPKEY